MGLRETSISSLAMTSSMSIDVSRLPARCRTRSFGTLLTLISVMKLLAAFILNLLRYSS